MSPWPAVRLDECAEIVSGATPKTSNDEYWGGRVHWVTPKDLSDLDGSYISDTPRLLTDRGLKSCAATVLPPQSVLFSSRAPIGLVAINAVPMATNQGFKSFVPKRDRLNPKFLYHWLRANRMRLEALGNGATFKEVSKAVVSRVEIPLPPLPEQRRIADILDAADELRVKRRVALKKLDELTQSIFLDMFGDPATNPRGWPMEMLGALLTFQQYGPRFYNEAYADDGVRIVRITDLDESGVLRFTDMPRMSVSAEDEAKYRLHSGDLIFARTGATVGKVALIGPNDPSCIAGAYFIVMRFDPKRVAPGYALAVLMAPSIRAIVSRRSRQAAQQNFSGPGLRALPMPLPPIGLQREFIRRLANAGRVKQSHITSLAALETLFASLQHRAFRGELASR